MARFGTQNELLLVFLSTAIIYFNRAYARKWNNKHFIKIRLMFFRELSGVFVIHVIL